MAPNKEDSRTIEGLLVALADHGFIYRARVQETVDATGTVVDRKLVQIWFTHPRLIEAIRRFVSDFLIVIDGTFNTNSH